MHTVDEAMTCYAVRFYIDEPDTDPTDENLGRALKHCALLPRAIWLPEIRKRVINLRFVDLDGAFVHFHRGVGHIITPDVLAGDRATLRRKACACGLRGAHKQGRGVLVAYLNGLRP